MSRPPSDRERVLQLEARVAELEEELAAWRAADRADRRLSADAFRRMRIADRLRPHMPVIYICHAAMTASLLLLLIEHAGEVLSGERLGRAICKSDEIESPDRLGAVAVTWARATLKAMGFEGAIRTVWGTGYMVERQTAAGLKALLEPADG